MVGRSSSKRLLRQPALTELGGRLRTFEVEAELGQNRSVASLVKLSPQPVIREKYALRNQR
jgi:hypothetical protein